MFVIPLLTRGEEREWERNESKGRVNENEKYRKEERK